MKLIKLKVRFLKVRLLTAAEDCVKHPTTQWLVKHEHKLRDDPDLRKAAQAGGLGFALLALGKSTCTAVLLARSLFAERPLVVAPLVGGTGAWIASLALFKPEVIVRPWFLSLLTNRQTESLKDTYNWMYKQTRCFVAKK